MSVMMFSVGKFKKTKNNYFFYIFILFSIAAVSKESN